MKYPFSIAHDTKSNETSAKISKTKRVSLIMQLGPSTNSNSSPERTVKNKRSMPSLSGTDSPADAKKPNQGSPASKNRRRSSTVLSDTATSFADYLRSTANPLPATSDQETNSKVLQTMPPKKVRGLSEVLSQMTTLGPESPEIQDEEIEDAPELTAIKEVHNLALTPSKVKRLSRSASASTGTQVQRVKSFMLPRPDLPAMPTRKLRSPRYEKFATMAHASSFNPNSPSSSSPNTPPEPEGPVSSHSGPPTHTDPDESIAIEPYNLDSPALSTPTSTDSSPATAQRLREKRRMSYDFSSLTQPLISPPTPPFPTHKGIKRSRSLWAQKSDSAADGLAPASSANGRTEPMSERQRALNVKRARKMAQLFGSEPPSALYQITNLKESIDEDVDSPVEDRRDSIAAIISLSPLPSPVPHSRSASMPVSSPTDVFEPGLTSDRTGTSPPSTPRSDSEPIMNPSHPEFSVRRRRAAKLSQFFGVGYHDLSGAMIPMKASPLPPPPPPLPLSPTPPLTEYMAPRQQVESIPSIPSPPDISTTSMEVDVKMSGPARFWARVDGRRNLKDANMKDVIGTLREMKAR